MAIKLRKLSYGLGAEICDIDVAAPMSESAFGEVHRAFWITAFCCFAIKISRASSISNSAVDLVNSTGTMPSPATVIPPYPN